MNDLIWLFVWILFERTRVPSILAQINYLRWLLTNSFISFYSNDLTFNNYKFFFRPLNSLLLDHDLRQLKISFSLHIERIICNLNIYRGDLLAFWPLPFPKLFLYAIKLYSTLILRVKNLLLLYLLYLWLNFGIPSLLLFFLFSFNFFLLIEKLLFPLLSLLFLSDFQSYLHFQFFSSISTHFILGCWTVLLRRMLGLLLR